MRVFYSPISGFPSAAMQTNGALFQTPVEGDAATDFEGLFRSLLAGAQSGAETSQENGVLAAFLSGALQEADELASAIQASPEGGQIFSSMRCIFANCLLKAGQTPELELSSGDGVNTSPEETAGEETLSTWENPWQWMFPFSFQDILARSPLTDGNAASVKSIFSSSLLQIGQTEEPGVQDGTDEGRISGDPILAYLASLAPGTPVALDFSFSLEQQTVFLDGDGNYSPVASGNTALEFPLLDSPGNENIDIGVVSGDGTAAMSPKGENASVAGGENLPTEMSETNENGTLEVDPDRLRGISFYRSFSMSRSLRVLDEFSGDGVPSAKIPSDGDVAKGNASRESGSQDTTLAGVSPVSSAGVSGIGDETGRISPKSTKETDSANPARIRDLAMDVLISAGRTSGETDGAHTGDKRGRGERNDLSDRPEALQRLLGNLDSAIQNGQKNGVLSFKSVMKDVLASGAPLMTAQEPAVFGEGVSNVVRFLTVQGETRASIVIEPPALGRVDIELSQTAGGIEASLKVNTEQLRQYIQDQSAMLRNILQQQGVVLTEFSVDVRDMAQRDGSKNEEQRRQARVRGVDDPEAAEEVADFRIDLEQGLLYWVA